MSPYTECFLFGVGVSTFFWLMIYLVTIKIKTREIYSKIFPFHLCGLYLEHNTHKSNYEETSTALTKLLEDEEINRKEYSEMLTADSIWSLQWYPNTPIGSYSIYSATFEGILNKRKKFK